MVIKLGRFINSMLVAIFQDCRHTLSDCQRDCVECLLSSRTNHRTQNQAHRTFGCNRYPECEFTLGQTTGRDRSKCGHFPCEKKSMVVVSIVCVMATTKQEKLNKCRVLKMNFRLFLLMLTISLVCETRGRAICSEIMRIIDLSICFISLALAVIGLSYRFCQQHLSC